MTTVSKPKRNPASADVSDQKKTRAFIDGSSRRAHLTINASGTARKCLGLHFELQASGQLEPPRLTVYRDIGRTMPGAISNLGSLSASPADFGVSSKGLQHIDFKRKWWNCQTHLLMPSL